MLLNFAIDSAPGNQPQAKTAFPAELTVDWVRVYTKGAP